MRDGGILLALFLGGVVIGCLLRRLGPGVLIVAVLIDQSRDLIIGRDKSGPPT